MTKSNNLATLNFINNNNNFILSRVENHFKMHLSYLKIVFDVLDSSNSRIANDATVRFAIYGIIELLSSIKLETSVCRTIQYIKRSSKDNLVILQKLCIC